MKPIKLNPKILFGIILLFISFAINADENKLARINDKDGFTNLRSGQGKDFKIITTIKKDELFYCNWTNEEWIQVFSFQWIKYQQVIGFMHRSKIQLIELLPDTAKKELLQSIFKKEAHLANDFQKSWKTMDTAQYKKSVLLLENYGDNYYYPVLDAIFPNYICKNPDTITLQVYFKSRWANQGSASEIPAWVTAKCFLCNPGLLTQQVKYLKNKNERDLICDDIEFGLFNIYDVDEKGKSKNKEYYSYKKKLDSARK